MSIDNVTDIDPRVQYVASAAQTAFVYPFPIFQDADLVVIVDGVTKTLTTHYTVSGEGADTGGTVTFLSAMTGGEIVTIYREIAIERTTDVQQNGPWSSTAYNDEQDKTYLLLQELKADIKRALRIPKDAEVDDDDISLTVANFANTYLSFDADGKPTPAALSATTMTQATIGQLLYPRTATEIAAGLTPVSPQYEPIPEDIRRWGAVDTGGVTDSTDEINDAFDALNAGTIKGGGVVVPGDANSVYNISAAITVPSRASGDNHTRWYSFKGMGRGAPRITALTGLADAPMISAAGQDASTYSFYREFKDFYLNGAGIAQRGIEIYYNQHFKIENVFITAMDDGSSSPTNAAGVRCFGAICAQFRDIKVHNGDGHGIFAHGGSGNFFNANLVEGCSFLDLAGDGANFTGGASGNAFLGNTFELCYRGLAFAGYSGSVNFIGGNYFEQNEICDLYLGYDTTCDSVVFEGNYLNGYSGATGTSYTPIIMKYANNCVIRGNMVNVAAKSASGYYLLNANPGGGTITNCAVENNMVRGLATSTAPNQIYNLPGDWVHNGNSLIDPIFAPLIQSNMIKQRFPYGGWTVTVTGTGTAIRSGSDILGAPALLMTRPAASTCSIAQTFTIQAHFKNRFVTFAVPVTALANSGTITVSITPNGTSPQTTTITVSTLLANEQTIIYAMGFVPSDATTIACEVSCTTDGGQFIVGHPCLYVGASRFYSSDGETVFRNTAAPTTGTWVVGDIVMDSTPASGTPMGWGCSVAGAPGTWVAMANYP